MRQLDLFASDIRRLARVGDAEIVDAAEFAERLLGDGGIVVVDRLPSGARLRRLNGRYRVEVADGMRDMNFAAAHEVAHWALRELARYSGPDEERFANYIAAALLMPRSLVREGARFYGRQLEPVQPLAAAVFVSQTAAQLRLGEVIGDERVVVTRSGNVLRSNVDSFAEPDTRVVAHARRRVETPGVVRAPLRGGIDDGRVALRSR